MRHLLVLLAAPTLLLALAACGDGGAAPDAQPILDAQLVPDAGVTDAGGMPPDAGPAADAGAQADASSCAATAVPASAPNVMVSSTAADVFPAPTGPFAIATHRMHLVDPARGEDYTEDPDDHRELMISCTTRPTNGAAPSRRWSRPRSPRSPRPLGAGRRAGGPR
jgi:hypothetical protein